MPRPARTRHILKWTGAVLSLVILATWLVSLWWQGVFVLPGSHAFTATYGGITGMGITNCDVRTVLLTDEGFESHDWYGFGFEWPQMKLGEQLGGTIYYSRIVIPFWLLLFITVASTAWLWHRDRRRFPPGHCPRCGYDLTGNNSGVCPECGERKALANNEARIAN